MKIRSSVLVAVAVAGLTAAGCSSEDVLGTDDSGAASPGADGAPTTIVMAHTGSPGGSIYEFFDLFANTLEEESNGAIVVEMHPAGELGGDQQLLEALRLGSVDVASAATSNMAQYMETYNWVDLPYIFQDYDSASSIWQSDLRREFDDEVNEAVGTHVLAYINAGGYRVLANSQRQVSSLDDLAGLKLRTTDAPLEAALTRAWNANPTPVAWADTFSAVEQKIVDGLQLQPEWLDLNGFGAAISHVTEVNALMAFHVVQISDSAWQSLGADQQSLLHDVAERAAAQAEEQMIAAYANHLEKLEEDGVTITTLSDSELSRFRDAAVTTWDTFPDQDLLDRIVELQQ